MNDKEIVHPFQVVCDKSPLRSNSVLGRDFMSKYKANIDYEKGIVQVGKTKLNLVSYIKKLYYNRHEKLLFIRRRTV